MSALSFMLFPTCLEYLGWIYGTIVYTLIQTVVLDKMMCMSIEFTYSKVNQGATWGVIFSLFAVFVKDLQSYVHTNTCAFVYFIFISICVLNIMVTNAYPKYVDTGEEDRPALVTALLHSSPLEGPLPTNPSDKESEQLAHGQSTKENQVQSPEIMDRGLENLLPSVSVSLEKPTDSGNRDVEAGKPSVNCANTLFLL